MRNLLTLALSLVACVGNVHAESVAIRLTDGVNEVTIADGDVSGIGGATHTDLNPTEGVVTFYGSVGAWNINVSTGVGSAILGPGRLDLHSVNTSSIGTDTTLSILFTQTGMETIFPGWELLFGGTSTNLSSVVYQAWADDGDAAFGMGTLIGTVGPFANSPFSGTASGTVSLTGEYSLTQRLELTGIAGMVNSFGGDAELRPVVPESVPIWLLGITWAGLGMLPKLRMKLQAGGA